MQTLLACIVCSLADSVAVVATAAWSPGASGNVSTHEMQSDGSHGVAVVS